MWSAYLKGTEEEPIISPEREDLLTRFPTPAEYSTFYLFVETHPSPTDAIDCTEMIYSSDPEVGAYPIYTIDQLISLISTHTGPNAVHITKGQATEIYNLLHTDLDTPT